MFCRCNRVNPVVVRRQVCPTSFYQRGKWSWHQLHKVITNLKYTHLRYMKQSGCLGHTVAGIPHID